MKENEVLFLRINNTTANELKDSSEKWGVSESESLKLMLEFFKKHGISPLEDLQPNMNSKDSRLSQQINSLTAILRNIERTQTKPTLALLELLLEGKKRTYTQPRWTARKAVQSSD